MATNDYEVGNLAATLVAIHGWGQRVCAITLDETPRGVAKMHTPADEPPSSHVVNEFAASYVVGDAQDETAIRTCYRSTGRSFSTTHARNIQESTAPSKTSNKENVHPRSVKATSLVRVHRIAGCTRLAQSIPTLSYRQKPYYRREIPDALHCDRVLQCMLLAGEGEDGFLQSSALAPNAHGRKWHLMTMTVTGL